MTTAEKLAQARARQAQAWNDLEEATGIVLVTGSRRQQIEAAALRWVNARHQTGRIEKHQREEQEESRASHALVISGLPQTRDERAAYRALTGKDPAP